MTTDWKEMLASLRGDENAQDPQASDADCTRQAENNDAQSGERQAPDPKGQKLNILLDKKGRKGKVATIIEGFTLDDDAVAEIASELKRRIGTGGSSRGGEILLQGDWRDKAAELLGAKGFKVGR